MISFPVGEDINQGSNSGGSKKHTHTHTPLTGILENSAGRWHVSHLVAVLSNPVGHGLPRLRCGPIGEAKVRGFSGPA